MTTKPSSAVWVDEPFPLIKTPSTYKDVNSHYAVYCASEMAHAHNCILRSLNAILLQAPHVPTYGQAGYSEQDVKDLLYYVESWVKMVDHHHHSEETVFFPGVEKLAGAPLLAEAAHQHEAFHAGLHKLREFAAWHQAEPSDYTWPAMERIIDAFSAELVEHLTAEIDMILALERVDDKALRKCWDDVEKAAKAAGKISYLYDIFPCVLGSCDKTYEGGNTFPPLPSVMTYAIKYWFAKSNPGAWRFSPCDIWCRPRPLQFVPKN